MVNKGNKLDLIADMKGIISFAESLRQLDAKQWILPISEGKWAIRDIISHIALWDQYFYNEAVHQIAINEPLTLKHMNFEAFNQGAIEYASTRMKEQLIDELVQHRSHIIHDLELIPEEAYTTVYPDGEGHPFQINEYIPDFVSHDQHHIKQINHFLQQNE